MWVRDREETARFFGLRDTSQGEPLVEADPRWVNHSANSIAPHAGPFGSKTRGSSLTSLHCVFLTYHLGVPCHVSVSHHWAFARAVQNAALHSHLPLHVLSSCLETQLRCLLPQKEFHDPFVPSVYSYTVYDAIRFSLTCLYSPLDCKTLNGPIWILLIAVLLMPGIAPGHGRCHVICLENEKKIVYVEGKEDIENNVMNVVVVAEGGDFFSPGNI